MGPYYFVFLFFYSKPILPRLASPSSTRLSPCALSSLYSLCSHKPLSPFSSLVFLSPFTPPVGNLRPATRFRTSAQIWTKINNLWQYTKYRTHQSALTAVSPPDRLVSPLAGKRQNDPRSGHIHDRERAALHPHRESCNRAER